MEQSASAAFGGELPLGELTLSRYTGAAFAAFEDWVRNEIELRMRDSLRRSGLDREAQARICAEAVAKPVSDWDLYDWACSRRGLAKALALGLEPKHGKVAEGDLPKLKPADLRRTILWLFGLELLLPTGDEATEEDSSDPPARGGVS